MVCGFSQGIEDGIGSAVSFELLQQILFWVKTNSMLLQIFEELPFGHLIVDCIPDVILAHGTGSLR